MEGGFGLGEDGRVVGADFEFDGGVVGDAVEDGAAVDVGDVDGEVLVGIGEGGDLREEVGEFGDGVDAEVEVAAGVGAFAEAVDAHFEAAFAGDDEVMADGGFDGAAFEDEDGLGTGGAAFGGAFGEVGADDFFGGVGGDDEVVLSEEVWGDVAEDLEGEPNHHGAAFVVDDTGAVDAGFVGGFAPVEVVAGFFFRREDGVEMGDEEDGFRGGGAGATEEEVVAVVGGLGGDEFGFEAEIGEAVGGEAADGVDAGGIGGEAVAVDHAAQPGEGGGEMAGGGFLEGGGEWGHLQKDTRDLALYGRVLMKAQAMRGVDHRQGRG